MDYHPFWSTHADQLGVDLYAARRRFVLAREQSASHSPAAYFRAAAVTRRWTAAQEHGATD
jgi:hypothetical protein